MAKKFCVMTMGRTGSTSLIYAFRPFADVALPSRLFTDCKDEELIHLKFIDLRLHQFSHLRKVEVTSPDELVEQYYSYYDDSPYVGLKSMLQYHEDYQAFVSREDVFFISLTREDIVAQIASFMIAEERGTWRRFGKPISEKWTFDESHHQSINNKVHYITRANHRLRNIPNAVHLTYEEICTPGFANQQIDQFFERPIRIADPKGATDASSYVENWNEFSEYIIKKQEFLKTDEKFLASI